MKKTVFSILFLAFLAPIALQAQTWASDPVHSTVMYTIRHGVTPMVGMFKDFSVLLNFKKENVAEASVEATVNVKSVNMSIESLEKHLLSAEFFDAEQFPEWSFVSTSIKATEEENKYVAVGEITIHGVTKAIEIPFVHLGELDSPRGKKAGISAEFTLDRAVYGIGQDEGDKGFLGQNVKVNIYLELNPTK